MFRVLLLLILFSAEIVFAGSTVNPSGDASCPVKIAGGGKAQAGQAIGAVKKSVVAVAQSSKGIPSAASSTITVSGRVGGVTPTSAFTGGGNTSSAVPQAPFGPTPVGVVTATATAIISPDISGFNPGPRVITLPRVGGKALSLPGTEASQLPSGNNGPGTSPVAGSRGGGAGSCTDIQITTQTVGGGPAIHALNNSTSQVCTNGVSGIDNNSGAC